MTEKEKEREKKKKKKGIAFPLSESKLNELISRYMLASIIKKEKKKPQDSILPTNPIFLPFFSLTPPVFLFFQSSLGSDHVCMYAYLTLLKVRAW